MFVKNASAAELGTSRASMNHTGKSNTAKGVKTHTMSTRIFTQERLKLIYVHHSWRCVECPKLIVSAMIILLLSTYIIYVKYFDKRKLAAE